MCLLLSINTVRGKVGTKLDQYLDKMNILLTKYLFFSSKNMRE